MRYPIQWNWLANDCSRSTLFTLLPLQSSLPHLTITTIITPDYHHEHPVCVCKEFPPRDMHVHADWHVYAFLQYSWHHMLISKRKPVIIVTCVLLNSP